eukprot:TRINITY_DN3732_c0_g1_i1.p1 TRINITY_DN3732_c0_g1~~TRINITY_DN3732_c0_g1_i1.p1  ORF type:complete len:740 (+),score=194.99 TRINITY_DN3732_c0_g1_i1:257-2221(+)
MYHQFPADPSIINNDNNEKKAVSSFGSLVHHDNGTVAILPTNYFESIHYKPLTTTPLDELYAVKAARSALAAIVNCSQTDPPSTEGQECFVPGSNDCNIQRCNSAGTCVFASERTCPIPNSQCTTYACICGSGGQCSTNYNNGFSCTLSNGATSTCDGAGNCIGPATSTTTTSSTDVTSSTTSSSDATTTTSSTDVTSSTTSSTDVTTSSADATSTSSTDSLTTTTSSSATTGPADVSTSATTTDATTSSSSAATTADDATTSTTTTSSSSSIADISSSTSSSTTSDVTTSSAATVSDVTSTTSTSDITTLSSSSTTNEAVTTSSSSADVTSSSSSSSSAATTSPSSSSSVASTSVTDAISSSTTSVDVTTLSSSAAASSSSSSSSSNTLAVTSTSTTADTTVASTSSASTSSSTATTAAMTSSSGATSTSATSSSLSSTSSTSGGGCPTSQTFDPVTYLVSPRQVVLSSAQLSATLSIFAAPSSLPSCSILIGNITVSALPSSLSTSGALVSISNLASYNTIYAPVIGQFIRNSTLLEKFVLASNVTLSFRAVLSRLPTTYPSSLQALTQAYLINTTGNAVTLASISSRSSTLVSYNGTVAVGSTAVVVAYGERIATTMTSATTGIVINMATNIVTMTECWAILAFAIFAILL